MDGWDEWMEPDVNVWEMVSVFKGANWVREDSSRYLGDGGLNLRGRSEKGGGLVLSL